MYRLLWTCRARGPEVKLKLHPTRGIAVTLLGRNGPLPGDGQPIILGEVVERSGDYDENDIFYGLRESDTTVATSNPASKTPYNPNDPMMPIAWTKSYQLPGGQTGKSFTSTIGSSTDQLNEGVRRLLVNAVYWLSNLEVPARANVELVGDYQPSAYGFKNEENYWKNKNLKVDDLLTK